MSAPVSAMLLCDFYKISHREQYPEKTEMVYSTWTPRESRIKDIKEVICFGVQGFIQEFLIEFFNENFFSRDVDDVVKQYSRVIKYALGVESPETQHIADLHRLGRLPLEIKALPEGTLVPIRVPMLTIRNTDPRFFWVTNYVETLLSCQLWQPMTSATVARQYRQLLDTYALKTTGTTDFVPFQGHDFSMRGMSSLASAMISGAAHLLSFVGTDTIPAIAYLEHYYGANIEKEMVGTSIPATEHSVQCAYGDDEVYLRRIINEVYPKGMVSIVSDGYDYWKVIGEVIPSFKDDIMKRDGKVVIRPDSGDPVKIVCGDPKGETELERKGTVEALWDIFGGEITQQGFKQLDPHIGVIYGDAITVYRCYEICEQLFRKGFASTNLVYGIGSFTYQYNTRDTFGFALKSTMCVIDGTEKEIFKDPLTDSGVKKSQKGYVRVDYGDDGKLALFEQQTKQQEGEGLLKTVFYNGVVTKKYTLAEIRERLRGQ